MKLVYAKLSELLTEVKERGKDDEPNFIGANERAQHLRRMRDSGPDRAPRTPSLTSSRCCFVRGYGHGLTAEANAFRGRYSRIAGQGRTHPRR